jgi:alkylation response protein AidB-like acyl-CoA dehydrogenase
MDFSWSDEQRIFKQTVIDFAQNELNEEVHERDRHSRFSKELWLKCGEFGLLGLSTPEQFGGCRTDSLTGLAAMEGLGYGCRDNGLNFGINAHVWTATLPIVQFGSDEQKERFLPGMCKGELIGADAFTEPEAGSDVFSIKTRAEKTEAGYLLNGIKRFITFGPLADVIVAFAVTDPSQGKWGLSAFLIEKDTPGVHTSSPWQKMGLRSVPLSDIIFDDCFVPESSRLGKEGAGVAISQSSLEWERCFILASQLGAMERQLEMTIEYARERTQFNQPIGKFQSVSNRVADMKLRLETARLLLYKVAWLKDQGKSAMMEAALLKLYLSEAFVESSFDAIRIHGGYGYMSEYEVERDLRDAIGGVLYGGTSDIQRNIISRLLGL